MAATSAGAVVVPIYQTNSPEECLWVISDSDACAIVCEDEEQLAKIAAIRDQVPQLRTIVVIDPPAGWSHLKRLDPRRAQRSRRSRSKRCASVDAAARPTSSSAPRRRAPGGSIHVHLHLRHHRAAEGLRAQPRQLPRDRRHGQRGSRDHGDEVTYLYLPLAHSYALLIQLAAFDLGSTLAYFGGDTKQIVPELLEVKPTYLPSVPRVFEKIYTLAHGAIEAQPPEEQERAQAAIELGVRVRDMMAHGEPVPEELQRQFDEADEQLFKNVRAIFGGNVRHATSGAAPIAREILEFFYACGMPVFEGYGMTETATAATISTLENHRFGTVGRALPGVELKIADDGEILIKGPNIFQGYHNAPTQASARSRTAGCTPATSARSTRTATCRSPGARRTSSSPPAARTSRRRTSRTTSSSAAGSRRP